jgi:hypothetical protein
MLNVGYYFGIDIHSWPIQDYWYCISIQYKPLCSYVMQFNNKQLIQPFKLLETNQAVPKLWQMIFLS